MKQKWILFAVVLVAGLFVFAGSLFKPSTEWGAPSAVGNGEIRSFVSTSVFGNPKGIGVSFSEAALSGLPDKDSETLLRFPDRIKSTPVDHFALNWNPQGHVPSGVYNVPHFDFHFYTVSENEVAAITPGVCTTIEDSRVPDPPGVAPVTCEVFDKGTEPLPAGTMPPGYTLIPMVMPHMGAHMINLNGPEFKGKPFTYTWIYGAFGGKVTFLEPMITKAFLESREDVTMPIPVPQAIIKAGWYPTEYSIHFDGSKKEYTVTLESFKRIEAYRGEIAKQ